MKKAIYYLVILGLSLLGLWAFSVRISEGMAVTALTSYVSWGLWVSVYIYFIGLSAGSFLLSTMIYVFGMHQLEKVGRMALLTALYSLFAGLLFIWLDLGHLERALEIFTRPQFGSIMTIESWLYLFYMLLILTELWLLMLADLARLRDSSRGWMGLLYRLLALGYRPPTDPVTRQRSEVRVKYWLTVLGVIGIPTAIGVHGGTGSIFAVAIARPYWNTGLFPIVFLISALASGSALVAFLYGAFGPRGPESVQVLRRVGTLTVLFIALDLLLLLAETVVTLYGGVPSHVETFTSLFAGPYPSVFWFGQLGLAAAVPIAMVAVGSRKLEPSPQPLPLPRLPSARPAMSGLATAGIVVAALVAAGDVFMIVSRTAPTMLALPEAERPAIPILTFWAAQLVLIACIIVVVAERWGNARFWLSAAGASTVVGILAVRLNIVIPGFVVPVLEHLERAYQDQRLGYAYFPSQIEWASTVGLVALVVLLFSVAYEVLPIYGPKEGVR